MNPYLRAQIAKHMAALARMDSSPASRVPSQATHRFVHACTLPYRARTPTSTGAGAVRPASIVMIRAKQEAAAEEWREERAWRAVTRVTELINKTKDYPL